MSCCLCPQVCDDTGLSDESCWDLNAQGERCQKPCQLFALVIKHLNNANYLTWLYHKDLYYIFQSRYFRETHMCQCLPWANSISSVHFGEITDLKCFFFIFFCLSVLFLQGSESLSKQRWSVFAPCQVNLEMKAFLFWSLRLTESAVILH